MINVVVPMAGRGRRFANSAEQGPKPLIEVQPGRPMIEYVVGYLTLPEPHRFTFVCLAEHAARHRLAELLDELTPGHRLLLAEDLTRGPAASALLAAPHVGGDDELLVAYCDSFFTIDMAAFLGELRRQEADGGVLIYPSAGSMEAYAELDGDGRVVRIAEKQVISADAVAGLYYFRSGRDFVAAATATVDAAPEDSEVFVSTVYNAIIAGGGKVIGHRIERQQRIEMGTPADLAMARLWLEYHRPVEVTE